jgi:hypothetical protein
VRARLPWILLAVWAVLTAVVSVVRARQGEPTEALIAPALLVFAGTGALLSARRPGNPIGWLLLAVALVIGVTGVTEVLYTDAEGDPHPSLLARCLVWFDNWVFYVWMALICVLIPLLFPDGRLPSRRWRPYLWMSVATVTAAAAGTAFGSPTLDWGEAADVANPLRIPGPVGDAFELLDAASGPMFGLMFVISLAGVLVRLRRSAGVERLQLKWFAFAMSLLLAGILAAAVGEIAEPLAVVGDVGWSLFLAALILGLPLAIGVAVMRYRLYDIDLVINRALVYGVLTVTLAAAYLGTVLLVGLAVGESGFAVAVSTLAVAALFRPVRSRIQETVDRRFYRRRYDAQQTLEAFGARLRDELDLEALGADLSRVVRDTVQPAHVSLWLRRAP